MQLVSMHCHSIELYIHSKRLALHGCRGIGCDLVDKVLERSNQGRHHNKVTQGRNIPATVRAKNHNLTVTQLNSSSPSSIKEWAAGRKQLAQHADVNGVPEFLPAASRHMPSVSKTSTLI
eukprot:GHRR01019670.1.p1 GENE.GHRR01019670.1~~GHRR01019670.1.p1  ORF type:complete len:120 (+),score=17.55 GHRR01019670.1:498-857(+)